LDAVFDWASGIGEGSCPVATVELIDLERSQFVYAFDQIIDERRATNDNLLTRGLHLADGESNANPGVAGGDVSPVSPAFI
jgi:hypothetical protein